MTARALTVDELNRMEQLIPRFYYELLGEVDRRASARGAEELTDDCGIALTIYVVAGAWVKRSAAGVREGEELMRVAGADIAQLLGTLGDHVEASHGEYLPLFREAIRTPHVQSLAEQIQAYARQIGAFDAVADVDRG